MSDEKLQTLCVTGVVALVLGCGCWMLGHATYSYWKYQSDLLKEGKALIVIPAHNEIIDVSKK